MWRAFSGYFLGWFVLVLWWPERTARCYLRRMTTPCCCCWCCFAFLWASFWPNLSLMSARRQEFINVPTRLDTCLFSSLYYTNTSAVETRITCSKDDDSKSISRRELFNRRCLFITFYASLLSHKVTWFVFLSELFAKT